MGESRFYHVTVGRTFVPGHFLRCNNYDFSIKIYFLVYKRAERKPSHGQFYTGNTGGKVCMRRRGISS